MSVPSKNQPLVSIVMSVYNAATTLPRCLKSISQQTYQNFEVIITDDASTDESARVLAAWQTTLPQSCHIITQQQNQGLTKSLNQGWRRARGMYVARIDADDVWTPTKLEEQVRFLEANTHYGVVGSWYVNVDDGQEVVVRVPESDAVIRQSIYCRNPFGHSCVLLRTSLLVAVGGYDESIYFGQDYDLWFRLLPLTKLGNIPKVLCIRDNAGGLSRQFSRQQLWQSFKTIGRYRRRYRASLRTLHCQLLPLVVIIGGPVKQWWRVCTLKLVARR